MQITPPRDHSGIPSPRAAEEQQQEVRRVEALAPYPRVDEPPPAHPWRGQDRRGPPVQRRSGPQRQGAERRRGERRQMHTAVMLDTRSSRERRTQIRRRDEAAQPKRYPRLRGVSIRV